MSRKILHLVKSLGVAVAFAAGGVVSMDWGLKSRSAGISSLCALLGVAMIISAIAAVLFCFLSWPQTEQSSAEGKFFLLEQAKEPEGCFLWADKKQYTEEEANAYLKERAAEISSVSEKEAARGILCSFKAKSCNAEGNDVFIFVEEESLTTFANEAKVRGDAI